MSERKQPKGNASLEAVDTLLPSRLQRLIDELDEAELDSVSGGRRQPDARAKPGD